MSRVFFVDRDLGRHILPDALELAGLAVERHDSHFQPDTPDEELLGSLEPPVVVRVYRPSPRELVFEGKPGRVRPKILKKPEG